MTIAWWTCRPAPNRQIHQSIRQPGIANPTHRSLETLRPPAPPALIRVGVKPTHLICLSPALLVIIPSALGGVASLERLLGSRFRT